jgi:hypothetical protein
MNSTMEACVDAGLVLKVVAEADSDKAYVLFDRWADDGNQLIYSNEPTAALLRLYGEFFAQYSNSLIGLGREIGPRLTVYEDLYG